MYEQPRIIDLEKVGDIEVALVLRDPFVLPLSLPLGLPQGLKHKEGAVPERTPGPPAGEGHCGVDFEEEGFHGGGPG